MLRPCEIKIFNINNVYIIFLSFVKSTYLSSDRGTALSNVKDICNVPVTECM